MTIKAKLKNLVLLHDDVLENALKKMNLNEEGVVFVITPQMKLIGLLTDGDARRYLLSGGSLKDQVKLVMNDKPVNLHFESSNIEILKVLSKNIRVIPLVDNEERIVDWATRFKVRHLPLAEPNLEGNELNYLIDCVRTNWISSKGKFVTEFENMLADYVEVKHALAVSNGTAALHLALLSLGIGVGDEVIVPNFTFAASVNSIIYTGATPVLIDISKDTWTIDQEAVAKAITPKTKAIMPVHIYGHPCDMDGIIELARVHELFIIEDAAQALGSKYKGKNAGSFSDAACFSFYGNKIITTGEGGMILFRDTNVYERALRLRDHGFSPKKRYWHDEVGYNYRLTNLQSAIGVAQMERIDSFVKRKVKLASLYSEQLQDIEAIHIPKEADWAKSIFWLYTIMLDVKRAPHSRDDFLKKLEEKGVEARPVFYPIHQMPPYAKYVRKDADFSVSIKLSEEGISLPSAISLTNDEIYELCKIIRRLL